MMRFSVGVKTEYGGACAWGASEAGDSFDSEVVILLIVWDSCWEVDDFEGGTDFCGVSGLETSQMKVSTRNLRRRAQPLGGHTPQSDNTHSAIGR